MTFKHFIMQESGHIAMKGRPVDITVLRNGVPTPFSGVSMIDPRFEFYNIPLAPGIPSRANKFMGDTDFSLPIVDKRGGFRAWLVSKRANQFSGNGYLSINPVGYAIPKYDWGHADIIGSNGMNLEKPPVAQAV